LIYVNDVLHCFEQPSTEKFIRRMAAQLRRG
jgi:hypothetical protein